MTNPIVICEGKDNSILPYEGNPILPYEGKGKTYVFTFLKKFSTHGRSRGVHTVSQLTYLMWAILYLDAETLKRFVLTEEDKKEINAVSSNGLTALMYLARFGRGKEFLVSELVKKGADVNAKSSSINGHSYPALYIASCYSDTTSSDAMVVELLNAGADVNSKSSQGYTALMAACHSPEASASTVCHLAHQADADLALANIDGNTAFVALVGNYAENYISPPPVKDVIAKAKIFRRHNNFDANQKGGYGGTLLTFACKFAPPALIEYILDDFPEIDVNAPVTDGTNAGRTAISYLIERFPQRPTSPEDSSGVPRIIRKMFERGARFTERDATFLPCGIDVDGMYYEFHDRFVEAISRSTPSTLPKVSPTFDEAKIAFEKILSKPKHTYNLRSCRA